jgi:predicted lipid-binding transport protein (Tim44 family)
MIGGLVAGGLLGSLLFGGGGSGFGFTDLVVFGLLIFFLLRKMRSMQAAPIIASADSNTAHAMTMPARGSQYARGTDVGFVAAPAPRPEPVLDAAEMSRVVTDIFLKVQEAWMARDMEQAGQVLTPEMRALLQKDCDQMRAQGRINRLESVQVRSAEVTETWQEPGRDFVTLRVEASLRDEVVDEKTGAVLESGGDEPAAFTEYWTLTRAVWVKAWRLSAIQQPAVTSA